MVFYSSLASQELLLFSHHGTGKHCEICRESAYGNACKCDWKGVCFSPSRMISDTLSVTNFCEMVDEM